MKKAEVYAVIKDAKARSELRLADLVREAGGFLSAPQAAQLLGITTQELEAKQPLISIPTNGYPRFQFESEEMVNGVASVLSAIGVDEPWMQLNFFFLQLDELGGKRPVDAIRDGAASAVVPAAWHFGRQGAS